MRFLEISLRNEKKNFNNMRIKMGKSQELYNKAKKYPG